VKYLFRGHFGLGLRLRMISQIKAIYCFIYCHLVLRLKIRAALLGRIVVGIPRFPMQWNLRGWKVTCLLPSFVAVGTLFDFDTSHSHSSLSSLLTHCLAHSLSPIHYYSSLLLSVYSSHNTVGLCLSFCTRETSTE
jgi:hypothetical protein